MKDLPQRHRYRTLYRPDRNNLWPRGEKGKGRAAGPQARSLSPWLA